VGAREEAGDDGQTDGRSERERETQTTDATQQREEREGKTRREFKGADFLADHPERREKKIGERKRKGS
jgi:hypothetical protein